MEEIRIRPLLPEDMPQIAAMQQTRDDVDAAGAAKRAELMRWLAFHNPLARGEATYFVAETADGVVGYHGRMPLEFAIAGKARRGYFVHDLYVTPPARKQGLGFKVTMLIARAIEQESPSFFGLLGMTPLNLEMQRLFGYYETAVPGLAKPLNPHQALQKRLKRPWAANLLAPLAGIALRLADRLLLDLPAIGVTVTPLQRFDEETEALNRRLHPKTGISTFKSAAYLNWKYLDRPYPRETVLAARRDGRLSGYIIISPTPYQKDSAVGIIIDLMADPADRRTVTALIAAAVRWFRRRRFDSVRCIFSHPALVAQFRKKLFFPTEGKAFMLGNLDRAGVEADLLKDVKNWHLTLGESDTYMLSP